MTCRLHLPAAVESIAIKKLTNDIGSLALLQRHTTLRVAHVLFAEWTSEPIHVDIIVDAVRYVVERIARLGESRRPVEAALFRIRLVGHVEVQVRGVRENNLQIKCKQCK